MSGIIDCHCHILPGMDDGSASVEESIALLRMQAQQGIMHVIATPHFDPQADMPERFLQRRKEAWQRLTDEAAKHDGMPEVTLGAEVHYFRGISGSGAMDELTIGGKRCLLIEMDDTPWSEYAYRELEELAARRRLTPIVAHVERYIRPLRTFGIPQRLEQMPVMVQANAEFFLRRSTQAMALRMLKQGRIHLLGSDCHNMQSRMPNLQQATRQIERKLGSGALEWIAACQREMWM